MIVEKDFLSKVRRYFNLNLYEVKIWTALLSRGVSTAGELSEIADVPRSRSYDILESLEKKGFIVMKMGKPIKYMAIPPKEVIERVKKNVHKQAETDVKKLEELKGSDLLDELSGLHTDGIETVDPTDLSGSLKGRNNLYNHLDMTIRGAEKTVTIVTTKDGLKRKITILKPVFEQLKKRNVAVRIAAPLDKDVKEEVKELQKYAEIRNIDKTKARFVVVDSKELIFMVMDDKDVHPSYDVGIWVNTPFFASALEDLFELAWVDMETAKKVLKL
ncbi:TrmB family transcriptional regulator [Candidatus Woesearchaeota archaeon]|nr:TrmB family transcriptional regulator [Candidatus Woesearchaeota archaeon]